MMVTNGFLDFTFQTVYGQVHLGEANGGRVFLRAVEGRHVLRVLVHLFDKVGALHEHTAGATSRINHRAMVRIDKVYDHLHQCSGLMEPDTLIRDNAQLLRCQNGTEKNIQTIF